MTSSKTELTKIEVIGLCRIKGCPHKSGWDITYYWDGTDEILITVCASHYGLHVMGATYPKYVGYTPYIPNIKVIADPSVAKDKVYLGAPTNVTEDIEANSVKDIQNAIDKGFMDQLTYTYSLGVPVPEYDANATAIPSNTPFKTVKVDWGSSVMATAAHMPINYLYPKKAEYKATCNARNLKAVEAKFNDGKAKGEYNKAKGANFGTWAKGPAVLTPYTGDISKIIAK